MKTIHASLLQRIAAAEQLIAHYAANIRLFESGAAHPEVGELLANRLLLARKHKQLKLMKSQLAIRTVARQSLHELEAA